MARGLELTTRQRIKLILKAIDDGPRNFESLPCGEDDTRASTPFSEFPYHVNVRSLTINRCIVPFVDGASLIAPDLERATEEK
ncbi:hypothetical protein TNCV_1077501 [Trichonephila clavipes]|uniref:Uncharacterized protein n=1 Tax=Trichonephila clavipes TaxID=2585209 RepID=A0A8X6V8W4_TRICX|nr:hypothetical protein TNCV_1077501 [Trichonephila clavipes]